MNPVDRLLAQANPVPAPPPGRVTLAQERLLASIVDAPPRRRAAHALRLLLAAGGVVAVALAFVVVIARGGAGVDDEVEAPRPAAMGTPDAGDAELIHVVTRLYGTVYGPRYGERLDGWLQPSTGRVRIVITTGGKMTLQQVVGADDHVRAWQGALGNVGGMTEDRVAPDLAAHLRESVRDRMASLVDGTKEGFRRDNAIVVAAVTERGEYRGLPVVIHRVAPTLPDGKPTGFYFKWYTNPDNGDAIVAYERGPVGADGNDEVEMGEQLERLETFAADAPLDELDWRPPPPCPTPTPMPPPTPTPMPPQDGPDATPQPPVC